MKNIGISIIRTLKSKVSNKSKLAMLAQLTVKCGCFLLAYLCCSAVVSAQTDFSKLVAFGDSLSDTGNIANITIDFPFPFYQNRISDGPVALDYLASAIGSNADSSLHLNGGVGGDNYAIAGANILGSDAEDLSSQVSAYLLRTGNSADNNALYAVIIGGNDIRGIRSETSVAAANAAIDQMLDALIVQLTRLSNAGGAEFFIANVANIGRLPETIQRLPSDPGVVARAEAYSQRYNQLLLQRLTTFASQTGAQVRLFDLFSELESLINNASSFGFTQTQIGCFELDGFEFHPDCVFGFRFDRFVFFDNLHPTGATNNIVGQSMVQRLAQPALPTNANTVPIGALLMLLLNDDD